MIAYADTGFLVSLYGRDAYTAAAVALVKSRPVFLLTPIGEAEFISALELRIFRKEWTRREAGLVRDLFLEHIAGGIFRHEPLLAEFWERVAALSQRHSARFGTRTLDVLHVAAALLLRPDVFLTFDERQRKLARAEHLRVLPA